MKISGDVLITVATGFLSEADTERSGLVETHAYAVLDIRKIKGLHLLQLKNPWNHLRWKVRLPLLQFCSVFVIFHLA